MSLRVAVQMDPIETIDVKGDSSFALLLEAQTRGHEIFYYLPEALSLRDGRLYALGSTLELRDEEGNVFAVRRVEADYLLPAHFDDELTVETETEAMTGARIVLRQDVKRGKEVLFSSRVTLVAMSVTGRPTRLPANVRRHLG